MEKLNQVFTREGMKKIWRYYKLFFLLTFLVVSVVGVVLSIPKQKKVYSTNMEIMLSINSSSDSTGESERASVINTYKDLLISKSAVSEAETILNKESLNSQGIFESLGLSQNSNSQLLDLEIKRNSENEGQLIGKTLNEFAERSIKKSYPDKNVSVEYHFFQNEINGKFNYKLSIAAVVIGLFMGVVVLIMIDAFSSRILSSEYVESYNLKVLGKIKSE
jgi:capsular polysaccharide biosynthesis protein